jgi:hypothetical protein
MTLAAHAIVGASIANLMPSHPVLGFAAGFASHFLLDAIPHWDYHLASVKEDSDNPMNNDIVFNINFIFDLFKMGLDAILGIIIVLFLFGISNSHLMWTPLWGAIGALTPDALQFVYLKWKHEPIVSIHQFHILRIHSKKSLDDSPILGIFLQIIIVILFVIISK